MKEDRVLSIENSCGQGFTAMKRTCVKSKCAATTTVAVVDSRPEDYASLPRGSQRQGMIWRFLASAREALRLAAVETVDLWVVNVLLPDMPGSDLCVMLRSRWPSPTVYVVTDSYRAEDECTARTCGAALFVCKPVQPSWFDLPRSGEERCSAQNVKRTFFHSFQPFLR
jgi:PleD family two-component response regulator